MLLPLLNEVFGEHYKGDEKITFGVNEHYLNQQDGKEEKKLRTAAFWWKVQSRRNDTIWSVRAARTAVCWCGFLSMIRRLHWMKESCGNRFWR
jgi:hypothetical protein